MGETDTTDTVWQDTPSDTDTGCEEPTDTGMSDADTGSTDSSWDGTSGPDMDTGVDADSDTDTGWEDTSDTRTSDTGSGLPSIDPDVGDGTDGTTVVGSDSGETVTTGTTNSVRDFFPTFSTPLEWRVAYMYQDIKGLVTVGIGNLIDKPGDAAALPFEHRDSRAPATTDEIVDEWHKIKNAPGLAHGGHKAAEKIASLELSERAIDDLVRNKFDAIEAVLARFYPDWSDWPADARLGAHSIAWAGAGFPYDWPAFNRAATAHDWATAARESHLAEKGNPGLRERNKANQILFRNAAAVEANGLDRSTLYYPNEL